MPQPGEVERQAFEAAAVSTRGVLRFASTKKPVSPAEILIA